MPRPHGRHRCSSSPRNVVNRYVTHQQGQTSLDSHRAGRLIGGHGITRHGVRNLYPRQHHLRRGHQHRQQQPDHRPLRTQTQPDGSLQRSPWRCPAARPCSTSSRLAPAVATAHARLGQWSSISHLGPSCSTSPTRAMTTTGRGITPIRPRPIFTPVRSTSRISTSIESPTAPRPPSSCNARPVPDLRQPVGRSTGRRLRA